MEEALHKDVHREVQKGEMASATAASIQNINFLPLPTDKTRIDWCNFPGQYLALKLILSDHKV